MKKGELIESINNYHDKMTAGKCTASVINIVGSGFGLAALIATGPLGWIGMGLSAGSIILSGSNNLLCSSARNKMQQN